MFLFSGSSHTQGPLDGSLYATISKSPRSPNTSPTSPNISNGGGLQTPVKPLRGSTQNLISPPPEFRSPKTGELIIDNRYTRSVSVPAQNPVSPPTRSDSLKVLPNNYEEIKIFPNQTQKNSTTTTTTSTVRYSSQPPNSTQHHHPVNEIRIIEDNQSHQYNEHGRESSVRSPLTLSMDSGISSSGIANRRIQGSSVSPSSFPSQASPQGKLL